jgi:O-succinylbenzoic acid--CoA ligase
LKPATVELWPYRLAFTGVVETARGTVAEREGLLVRLWDVTGRCGLGEVAPLEAAGTEDLPAARAALEAARPQLDSLLRAEKLPPLQVLDAALDALDAFREAPAARAGVEQALLDLAAQAAGLPLYKLLSPHASPKVLVSALLAGDSPEALAASAAQAVAEGFSTLKLKVGGRPLDEDLARARAVRAAAPRAALRLDANGAWSAEAAIAGLRALRQFSPELCEQPVPAADLAGMRRVREALSGEVKIAADESLSLAGAAAMLLSPPAGADVLVLKTPVLGGILRALRLAERARAAGVEVLATTFLEGAVGRAGAAHLAAALGGERAHGLATGRLLAGDLGRERFEIKDGWLHLEARPGLGVSLADEPWNTAWNSGLTDSVAAHGSDARTVVCPVAAWAERAPAAVAVVFREGSLDYRALDARVRAFAAALRARGAVRGDTVALLAEATPDAVALLFAAARVGCAVALVNTRLAPAEVAALLARTAPVLVLAEPSLLPLAPGAVPLDQLASPAKAVPPSLRGPGTPGEPRPGLPRISLDAVWTLLFTSGTTGVPKAAEATVSAHLASARSTIDLLGLGPDTRFLCCLPLFHVGGFAIAVRCALAGGAVLLQRRFDAEQAARALASGATHASLVATTLARTLDVLEAGAPVPPPGAGRPGPAILVGGGPVPPALLARAGAAGLSVLQTYGLTEACTQVTCERPGEEDGQTAGAPVPGVQVRIVDRHGARVPALQEGQIEVNSHALFRGYRGDAAATAAALHEGWLRTGDLGLLDERGRLRVLARRTDLIVTGGENVYPAEVEAVLLTHPQIVDAAVAARPDAEFGEAVVAVLVARAGAASPSLEAVRAFCKERLAGFKAPREVRWVEALPRTAAGKIERSALRRMLAQR